MALWESHCIVLIDLILLRIGKNVTGRLERDRLGFRWEPLAWKNPSFKFLPPSFSVSPVPLNFSLSLLLPTHTHVCAHACVHTRVQCARAHMQTRTHTHAHTCMCTRTQTHAHMCTCTHKHACTCTNMNTCAHMHAHTHANTCGHTHTCKHTHTFQSSKEVCYVSELGLGQKRKAISPIPSMESLTLKGEGKGWITGESFLHPHRPSLL